MITKKQVSYLGIEGSNSFVAALTYFGEKNSFLGCSTIESAFEKVNDGVCDFAVVPIENSTTGSIVEVYDYLSLRGAGLSITGEVVLKIHHHLVGLLGATVRECYSHQQAFSQCSRYFKDHPEMTAHYLEDTATAAKKVKLLKDPKIGAVANKKAAGLYGLTIIKENIEDTEQNFTRFFIVSRTKNADGNKASIVYGVKHIPGSLSASLMPFAELGINLTKIESRPLFAKKWEYIFFLDLEIGKDMRKFQQALARLSEVTEFIKLLGIYDKGVIHET
jgi:chorismate mutase/prephenate dehydratase